MHRLSDTQKAWIPRGILALAIAGLAIHSLWIAGLRLGEFHNLVTHWIYNGVIALAAAVCLARAMLRREDRNIWLCFGLGLAVWTAGDVYWTEALQRRAQIPYPSLADVGYLGAYPFMYAGLFLLLRSRFRRAGRSVWLDGAIGTLAVTALGTSLLGPVLENVGDVSISATATNLAYPVADVLLVALLAGGAIAGGVRGSTWLWVGAGLLCWSVADGIYLYMETVSSYPANTFLDTLWLLAPIGIACGAATTRSPEVEASRRYASVFLPSAFAMVAVGVLSVDHYHAMVGAAVILATATLALVGLRLALIFRENSSLLDEVREESATDALTGLGNRRQLMADLERVFAKGPDEPPATLFAIFDLDGFKAYNDSFGHPAGDALLRRLGQNLEGATTHFGAAYRLGGDEFCILAPVKGQRRAAILAAASEALADEGEGFAVRASVGSVSIPGEANSAQEALRIADSRMYAEKGERSGSADRQTRDILLRILQERAPDLSLHLEGVTDLAAQTCRALALPGEEVDVIARAAELHDVGKIGIPDEILHKPASLDAAEWELMRTHTLIGERILGAAPAMVPVAKIVRHSHERWDGAGYPDGLAATDIPLGSRIIFICDAFEAMIADRPYQRGRPVADALVEIRRCAGTQFDPVLADAFCRVVAGEPTRLSQRDHVPVSV